MAVLVFFLFMCIVALTVCPGNTQSAAVNVPAVRRPLDLDRKWSQALKPHYALNSTHSYKPYYGGTLPNVSETEYWCKNVDNTDPEAIRSLWEEKGVSVWFGLMTRNPKNDDVPLDPAFETFLKNHKALLNGIRGPDKWPYHIYDAHVPGIGNPDLGVSDPPHHSAIHFISKSNL